MERSLIKLTYRQIIDASASTEFEKLVFNDSYEEFQLQSQAYNRDGKFSRLEEMIEANPKANSLHYKVGFAIGLYINGLENKIPGLSDNLNRQTVSFTSYTFEIVQSDIRDKSLHKVCLMYKTDIMTLIGAIGDHLWLASGDQSEILSQQPVDTFLLKMQPGLSINSYEEVPVLVK